MYYKDEYNEKLYQGSVTAIVNSLLLQLTDYVWQDFLTTAQTEKLDN